MRIFNTILVGIGIFFASFLIPVIGAVVLIPVFGAVISVPMSVIGAYFYYTYDKKN